MKKLLVYMKGLYRECVLAPLFKMFEATLELFVPVIMKLIIDKGIPSADSGYIIKSALLLALLALLGLAAAISAQYFAAKAAIGFSSRVRGALMKKIGSMSYSNLDEIGTSTLVTRMTSDVNQVQTGVNLTLRLLLRSPFVVFGAMIAAYLIDVKCALIFTGVIILLCVIVFGIMLVTMPMYKKAGAGLDGLTLSTRENLTGVRVIRAFRFEESEKEIFARKNDALTRLQRVVGRISALLNPVTLAVINIAVIILIYTGALQVNIGKLTQGDVFALYNYMSLILVELVKMASLIISITKSLASANRIEGVLEEDTSEEKQGSESLPEKCGGAEVVFDNVSFAYKGADTENDGEGEYLALKNISFKVKPGQTVGIIGGTGSGKSTLVNLIPAFYKATEGKITVDGIGVNDIAKENLRENVGVVPQKAVLFAGTIKSNLLWGNENASDEDIEAALKIACADDVVASKKDGLSETVSQGGTNFSGGQRQRLTIARALVKKPRILILDDSASALDYATDAKLRQGIKNMQDKPTLFIVSQRTAGIMDADLIVVLDNGEAVGVGTHNELLKTCEVYREIYSSQES